MPGAYVLLIDDEPNLLVGLSASLTRAGYDVRAVRSGAEGLEEVRRRAPDVIVCDVMMPPPDGFEVRRILASAPATADIPFLFLTARAGADDRVQGLLGGADDYITKPFDRRELVARVEATLRRREIGRRQGRDEVRDEARAGLERFRREVTSNLNHELRTPLTIVVSALELALEGQDAPKGEERTFLEEALRSAHRLSALILDLTRLKELDSGVARSGGPPLDPEQWLFPAVEASRGRWRDRRFVLRTRLDPGAVLSGQSPLVRHVMEHVLDNAVKFGPPDGVVEVATAPEPGGGVRITVTDEGQGIPPELRERVFERYFQESQGPSRRHDGLGIGLTLARSIARDMGGDVRIADSATGCRVEILLPGAAGGREGDGTSGPAG